MTDIYEDDLMSGLTDDRKPCQMCGEMHPEDELLTCLDCGYVSCEDCQEEHLNSDGCPHVCTHCPACCAMEGGDDDSDCECQKCETCGECSACEPDFGCPDCNPRKSWDPPDQLDENEL